MSAAGGPGPPAAGGGPVDEAPGDRRPAGPGAPRGGDPEDRLAGLLAEISDRQARREERPLLAPDGRPWPTGQQGADALAAAMRRTARLS